MNNNEEFFIQEAETHEIGESSPPLRIPRRRRRSLGIGDEAEALRSGDEALGVGDEVENLGGGDEVLGVGDEAEALGGGEEALGVGDEA